MLNIDCDLSWPLELFTTPTIIESYNSIHAFLFLVKRTHSRLSNSWVGMKGIARKGTNITRDSILIRAQMLVFINALYAYLQVDLIDVHYKNLMDVVWDPRIDINGLAGRHGICVKRILKGSFLADDPASKSIQSSICAIIKSIDGFCTILKNVGENGSFESGNVNKRIETLQADFGTSLSFLFRVFGGIDSRNYDLEKFLLRLDYNGWASRDL